MHTNLEIEYKTLVTQEQFKRLRDRFSVGRASKQINTYFDTPDRQLLAVKVACRIRISEHAIEATVKRKTVEGVLEYNVTLDQFDPSVFRTEAFQNLFTSLGIHGDLIEVGQTETYRTIVDEPLGQLCFDENHYNGKIDYELEYETIGDPLAGYARFMEILTMENIPYVPSISKMQRATA